ncbi:hypothetical protein CKAH01_16484 [Colletotrichum kahawae]|uniref:Fungal N-terminal domain-containing protein n=1 Tax=Colletotrichum kahawae TaxID=34407 RepID=A0AAE0D692_COLKA|nr:hypothetical protein CKAH01_16484 [Colletotrichum kahawae]
MAEVLGTVVGVISLGIQVSSAIGAYIEGVQCLKEEVESTVRHQKSFQVLLTQIGSIKDSLSRVSVSNTTALEEALTAANAQILQLDSFLGKVLVQHPSPSWKSTGQKFRDGQKKLLYPFRRDQLNLLDKKLDTATVALQAAMQVMELYGSHDQLASSLLIFRSEISMTTQTSVYQIHEETSTTNAVLLGIKTDIDHSILQSQSNNLAMRRDMDELKSVVEALVSANFDTTLTL